jgi:hypothetical protein
MYTLAMDQCAMCLAFMTTYEAGARDLSNCYCLLGYEPFGSICWECLANMYLNDGTWCEQCPEGTQSPPKSVIITYCTSPLMQPTIIEWVAPPMRLNLSGLVSDLPMGDYGLVGTNYMALVYALNEMHLTWHGPSCTWGFMHKPNLDSTKRWAITNTVTHAVHHTLSHTVGHHLTYMVTHAVGYPHAVCHTLGHAVGHHLTNTIANAVTHAVGHHLTNMVTHAVAHPVTHTVSHHLPHHLPHTVHHSVSHHLTNKIAHTVVHAIVHHLPHAVCHTVCHTVGHCLANMVSHTVGQCLPHAIALMVSHCLTNLVTHAATHQLS